MPATTAAVVADTHTLIWFLLNPARLSEAALSALQSAEATGEAIQIATITLVEMRYLVEKKAITEADFQFCLATLKDPFTAPTDASLRHRTRYARPHHRRDRINTRSAAHYPR